MASSDPDLQAIKPSRKPANKRHRRSVAAGTIPPTLPPSVEEAYRKKCVELKRRMGEVEQNNDSFRLRKNRLLRGIRKMRLERSILLHELGKRMRRNGADGYFDDDSENSSEGPPTPNDKPLRSKRSHRRPAITPPPLAQQLSGPPSDHHQHHNVGYHPQYAAHHEYSFSVAPTPNGAPHMPPAPPPQSTFPLNDLYPTAQSQIIFPLSARDYFIQRTYTHNPSPSMDGIPKDQLAEAGSRAWRGMPMNGIHEWENSYRHELTIWRNEMARLANETGEQPVGEFRSGPQEREHELYMRGGFGAEAPGEEAPGEERRDPEETAAASGGFTAVNG